MPRSPHSPLPALIGMILAIGLLGCSGGSKGPLAPDLAGPVGPIATSQPWQTGASSAFGVLSGTLYPDGRIEERVVRTGAAVGDIVDLDATEFFTQAPCRDCVKVTGVTHEPGTNNLMVSVAIRHPFSGALPRRDLHIFDVRGIFILPGTTVFNVLTAPINTGLETTETQSLQGDPGFITNADGFTTHFDYRAEDPRYVPDPVPVPGNLNPFKRYFVDPSMGPFQPAAPAGWNVCPMGADYETQTYILDRTRLTAPVNFAFVVDARWGQAAVRETRTTPSYYLPAFNRQEAWSVEAEVSDSTLQGGDPTSHATLTVRVKDWQANATVAQTFPNPDFPDQVKWAGDVDRVDVLVPGVSSLDTLTQPTSGGGSPDNPYVFQMTIRNDLQAPMGDYVGLVAVRDQLFTLSGPAGLPEGPANHQGLDIKDYTAYQAFTVHLDAPVDDPPMADPSATSPTSILTGQSATLDASASMDDMGIVKYEWDPGDGTGYIDNGTDPTLPHTYTLATGQNQRVFTATLRCTDTTDQTATATVDITVSRQTDDPPTADAQAQPSNIPSGQLVTLSASNSTDDFGITKYRWNPGDGTGWIDRGTFPTLSHRYTASVGTTFTATLEITDTSGQIDSDQVQVSVTVSNNPPVANLSLTAPTTGPSPLLVTFDGSLSTDDVGITKFEWDPGDGTGWHDQGVLTSYQHTYKPVATATYTARLRVTDGGGLTHIASTSITATVPNDCGLTGIGGPDAINVGQIITLTAQGAAPVYEWTENHPQLEFVGATDGPSVQVRALSVSGKIGDLTVWLNGANVTCNGSKTLTAYAISFTSPGADRRMYVNWEGGSATTEGREVTVNAIVSPPKAEVEVTLGFMDPDEPTYQVVAGQSWTQGGDVVEDAEEDETGNDNQGDNIRPDGTPAGGPYTVGYSNGSGGYAATRTMTTASAGVVTGTFQVSRYGGDNYRFTATCDPAGTGTPITASSSLVTVWRRYAVPVFSMEDASMSNEWYFKPAVDLINSIYAAAYVEITDLDAGYGGLLYTNPITSNATSQLAYLEADNTYDTPAEKYTPRAHGQMACGIDRFSAAGTIGLWSGAYVPSKLPPTGNGINDKPYLTRNYFTVATGRMMDYWSGNTLVTLENHVFAHELGHSLGLPHNDTNTTNPVPPLSKHGTSGIGVMAPATGPGVKNLFTESEIRFLRGADQISGQTYRGPYYE